MNKSEVSENCMRVSKWSESSKCITSIALTSQWRVSLSSKEEETTKEAWSSTWTSPQHTLPPKPGRQSNDHLVCILIENTGNSLNNFFFYNFQN